MELVGGKLGRIRVEALLGRGGMGEVYVGFDEGLQRRVAIKTIRAEHRFDASTRARFVREARILSKLDHPGICRIFDIIERDEADYLVLELIEGRTLRQVARQTAVDADFLEIMLKVATALAAAHQERIVHRDLKPENIMITAEGDVKVLDFGIARSLSTGEPPREREIPTVASPDVSEADGWHTTPMDGASAVPGQPPEAGRAAVETAPSGRAGMPFGTLAYMSPEQATGEPTTVASDMYSFGVILQELVTGSPAYDAAGRADLMVKVARAELAPPMGAPAPLAALIAALTGRDPATRPSAAAAVEALRHLIEAPLRRRRARWRLVGATGIALLLAISAAVSYRVARPAPLLTPGSGGRVAVLPFANQTGDPGLDWVERGLAEMVATALAEVDGVAIVSFEDISRLADDRSGSTELAADPDSLVAAARELGAVLAIHASLDRTGDRYTLSTIAAHVSGSVARRQVQDDDVVQAARDLAARLARRLNPEAEAVDLADRFSDSLFVNRLYAMGLHRLRTASPRDASRYFEVCLDVEPDFGWARLQLAACNESLSEWDRAGELATAVYDRATAVLDTRLQAASLNLLSLLAVRRSDFDLATKLAAEALPIQQKVGDRGGEAATLFRVGDAARMTGDLEAAVARYRESLAIRREIGDRFGEAHCLHSLGAVAAIGGDNEEAKRLLGEALGIERGLGLQRLTAMTLNSLGIIATNEGQLDEADALLNESLEIHRGLGGEHNYSFVLNNLAVVAEERAEWPRAEELLREAYDISVRTGDRHSSALQAFNLAYCFARQGKPDEGDPMLQVAWQWFGETWDLVFVKGMLAAGRGDYRTAVALMRRARSFPDADWGEEQKTLLHDYEQRLAP